MKLLICTQKVDPTDSVLGFFVRWIEEFEKYTDVQVISLKDLGRGGKLMRTLRLIRLAQSLEYDAVFVHMNPEYLVAAGWLWRLKGKKVSLWYTHKSVNLLLRIAVFFADTILTASKESFRLKSSKVRVLSHGIDTTFFTPDLGIQRESFFLSVGRLSPSKRHDLAIHIAASESRLLRIAGDGPERPTLERLARASGAQVEFLGALSQIQLRDEYRKASALIHTSETGSLDKVVIEALACGLPVRTNDPALKFLESKGPEYVAEHHALASLIPKILATLAN